MNTFKQFGFFRPVFAFGGLTAMALGLLSCGRNLAGWILILWGIYLLGIGYRGRFFLTKAEESADAPDGDRIRIMTAAVVLALSLIPPGDFLLLPPILPRPEWLPDAGLTIVAMGLLMIVHAFISWECWAQDDLPAFDHIRHAKVSSDHSAKHLESAGMILVSIGICLGYGSLLGALAGLLWIPTEIFFRKRRTKTNPGSEQNRPVPAWGE